ncbi:MAG: hypothetical protein ABI142_06455 [Bryocella sp.]
MVLPEGTQIAGKVIALRSDRKRRVRSRFNLDFTPFHIPVVQFTSLTLPSGQIIQLSTMPATDGVPVLRYTTTQTMKHKNIVRKEFDAVVRSVRDTVVFFTAAGKGDRILQLAYHQLPWHPQRIEDKTTWLTETLSPLQLSIELSSASSSTEEDGVLEATLDETVSSKGAKAGDALRATLAKPGLVKNRLMPQGTKLVGAVTWAKPSRAFGRNGGLRFGFDHAVLPSGEELPLLAQVSGVDGTAGTPLVVDAEGEVRPETQDKLLVPAILIALAVAPLDPDPGDNDEFIKNAGASNSLGVMGFATGVLYSEANLSAAFGFYGVALSTSDRYLRHGSEVMLVKNTRVELKVSSRELAN